MVLSLLTASEIAKDVGSTGERVRAVIRRCEIEPVTRAGLVRLFDSVARDRVQIEIDKLHRRLAKTI